MPEADRTRLAARTQAQYDGTGYRSLFVGDLNAAAAVWNDVALFSSQAAAAQAAAAGALAAALLITGGSVGIGTDPFELPRVLDIGRAGFTDPADIAGEWPIGITANTTLTAQDWGRTIVAESGTLTVTLPALADLPPGWWVRLANRSGQLLTVARQGADVIGAAATSFTIADGGFARVAYRNATRFERIG